MAKEIGKINKKLIKLLNLSVPEDTPIFLGDSNVQHMKSSHPEDYDKYGKHIESIIYSPDYVAINKKDNSIEYVKEFIINEEYVKVAVRVSTNGTYFARSLYVLNTNRVNNFIEKGTLLPY